MSDEIGGFLGVCLVVIIIILLAAHFPIILWGFFYLFCAALCAGILAIIIECFDEICTFFSFLAGAYFVLLLIIKFFAVCFFE